MNIVAEILACIWTIVTRIFAFITSKPLLTFITGWAVAIFSEPIKQRIFGPKLELHFEDRQEYKNILPVAEDSNELVTYIRVRVKNVRRAMAKNCKAHLINVERWHNRRNEYIPSGLKDSIQLGWSCKKPGEEFQGIDLAKQVNQFIDIVHAADGKGLSPHLSFTPRKYRDLFNFPGLFRYTIQVSADQTNPSTIEIHFEWAGKGHEITIKQIH